MPSRDQKPRPNPAGQAKGNPADRVAARRSSQPPQNKYFGATNSTRINAFVVSQGRRNQAKRDAR